MPNERFRMLWEFWGEIISGPRDKESLSERCNVLGLSPGRILDGRMGNTFWGKGGCISLSSLRSGHQDRIRHARDLLEELSVKGKREDLRSSERLPTTMHFWPLWKRRKEGGRRKSQTSTHFWEGLGQAYGEFSHQSPPSEATGSRRNGPHQYCLLSHWPGVAQEKLKFG